MLESIYQVHAPIVDATRPVPGEPGLRIDRTVGLRRYEVEPADVCVSHVHPRIKACWPQPIGIDVHEDLATALPALSERAGLHDLTCWTDGDIAVGTVVGARDDFRGDEAANLPESRYGCSRSHDRTSAVEYDPDLALCGCDRGLVDESEQAPSLSARRQALALLRGLRDIRDRLEVEAAIGAESDGDHIPHVEEIGEEEVAVVVERQAWITTGGTQIIVIPDQGRRPGRATVEAHALEQPGCRKVHVRDDDDILPVGRIDSDCFLGLVGMPLADVDVLRHRGERQSSAETSCMGLARVLL
ncbi:MAG TPA: hypothetical protein VF043_05690 [Ktedonobacteraceae bacterium]